MQHLPPSHRLLLTNAMQVQASASGSTLTIHLSFMNRFSLDDLFRPPPDPSCPALVPAKFPERMCCYVAGKLLTMVAAPAIDVPQLFLMRAAAGKVLTALDFLQRQRKLAHGNVKGSNVLVSSTGEVKLSDLQACKNLREEFKQSSLSIVSSRGNPSDKRYRCSSPCVASANGRLMRSTFAQGA